MINIKYSENVRSVALNSLFNNKQKNVDCSVPALVCISSENDSNDSVIYLSEGINYLSGTLVKNINKNDIIDHLAESTRSLNILTYDQKLDNSNDNETIIVEYQCYITIDSLNCKAILSSVALNSIDSNTEEILRLIHTSGSFKDNAPLELLQHTAISLNETNVCIGETIDLMSEDFIGLKSAFFQLFLPLNWHLVSIKHKDFNSSAISDKHATLLYYYNLISLEINKLINDKSLFNRDAYLKLHRMKMCYLETQLSRSYPLEDRYWSQRKTVTYAKSRVLSQKGEAICIVPEWLCYILNKHKSIHLISNMAILNKSNLTITENKEQYWDRDETRDIIPPMDEKIQDLFNKMMTEDKFHYTPNASQANEVSTEMQHSDKKEVSAEKTEIDKIKSDQVNQSKTLPSIFSSNPYKNQTASLSELGMGINLQNKVYPHSQNIDEIIKEIYKDVEYCTHMRKESQVWSPSGPQDVSARSEWQSWLAKGCRALETIDTFQIKLKGSGIYKFNPNITGQKVNAIEIFGVIYNNFFVWFTNSYPTSLNQGFSYLLGAEINIDEDMDQTSQKWLVHITSYCPRKLHQRRKPLLTAMQYLLGS